MDAHQPVTLKEGDRYPLGPPILFRETRARCMGLTVNQWLDEFDSHTRSQVAGKYFIISEHEQHH